MKHDWEKMLISRVCPDHNELRKIRNELISNFAMLKEIFHYLQAMSKSFPKLELRVLENLMINHMGLNKIDRNSRN